MADRGLAAAARGDGGTPPSGALFSAAPAFAVDDLDADTLAELTGHSDPRHVETGRTASCSPWFGSDGSHVVTAAKERLVLRPHGHVLRTGDALVPDTGALTSTLWMTGTFHSQLTRGHVGRDRLLSTRRGYLGVQRAHGLRVFVEDPTTRRRLGPARDPERLGAAHRRRHLVVRPRRPRARGHLHGAGRRRTSSGCPCAGCRAPPAGCSWPSTSRCPVTTGWTPRHTT